MCDRDGVCREKTILERAYWYCPTRVLIGATWFIAGFGLAMIIWAGV